MTLERRLVSRRDSAITNGIWGSFVWGTGVWGGEFHSVVGDVESSSVALSRFSLQAYPFIVLSRPWGSFIWGQDGWGIPAVSLAVVTSGEPVTRIPTGVEGS